MSVVGQKDKEMIVNQFYLVMMDRMLKEKYNEIEYLAIQQPPDPNIVEIEKKDLNWLLAEHERADMLQDQYSSVINSHTWRLGVKISHIFHFLLQPIYWIKKR